jgi:hypothetical protein
MNVKSLAVFQAALLGLLLTQGGKVLGQTAAAPEERTSRAQLERAQRTFLIYIQDGENEYQNATNRRAQNMKLWPNNVAMTQYRLDETFTLMDGNEKVKGHQAQIGSLKKLLGEARWVNLFTTNYLALRNRAYDLQNKLLPLVNELDPATRAAIQRNSDAIRNEADPEAAAAKAISTVRVADERGTTGTLPPASPQPPPISPPSSIQKIVGDFSSNPNSPSAVDSLKSALINSASDPLSPDEAEQAIAAFRSGNIPALRDLLKKHPGNQCLAELMSQALQKAGASPQDAADYASAVRNNNSDKIQQIEAKYPGNPAFKQPEPPVLEDPSTFTLPPGAKLVGADGRVFDYTELLDPQGRLKKHFKRAAYIGAKGGQIDSEIELNCSYKESSPGSFVAITNELPETKIDWLFSIKPSLPDPSGTVTYELVNDDPAKAEFTVTSWEGPDGEKKMADLKFTVPPKPGHYDIKVHGLTTKYKSPFTIVLPVNN